MERINIVVTSDDQYIQHLGVMLTSLFDNTNYKDDIDIYFLDHGIADENKKSIESIVEQNEGANLYFVKLDKEIFENFYISEHINQVTYYRIMAPMLLPRTIKKAIYLDSDIIVKDDIKILFSSELDGYTVGAILDPQGYERFEELNITTNRYFNAGILVIDLVRWRDLNYTEKLIDFINSNARILRYWDQDALNALLNKDWKSLHPRWNILTSYYDLNVKGNQYEEVFKSPGIIHFTTFKKPWGIICEHPLKNEYYTYLNKTEWADYSPIPKNVQKFLDNTAEVYIFGTGALGKAVYENLDKYQNKVIGFIDNDQTKWESYLYTLKILSPEILRTCNKEVTTVLVCSMYKDEICSQLQTLGFNDKDYITINYY